MIYSSLIQAKNGEDIPLFTNSRPMHSKYNPDAEGALFAKDVSEGFIIIGGIGGAYHVKALSEKITENSYILCVEADNESLNFCRQISCAKELEDKPNVSFATIENLQKEIISKYIPALHGNLQFVGQRAWENFNSALLPRIKDQINEAAKKVGSDYSVQSHFGKLWQRNIILNSLHQESVPKIFYDRNLIAAVIAAGPSLDESINELKQDRNSFYIIATDTTLNVLQKKSIQADVVVSIDGQNISSVHFMNTKCREETIYVFDISGNANCVKSLSEKGNKIFFTHNSHPLSTEFSLTTENPYLETGSGTVTIAACDFARYLGFKRIKLFGADFCYSNGKAYTKGTYLDSLYNSASSKINTSETAFTSLLFRTELEDLIGESKFSGKLVNAKTSPVLKNYETSLYEWAKKSGYILDNKILVNNSMKNTYDPEKSGICEKITAKNLDDLKTESKTFCLLPYIAWLRKNHKDYQFKDLLKLAYLTITMYTVMYEDKKY